MFHSMVLLNDILIDTVKGWEADHLRVKGPWARIYILIVQMACMSQTMDKYPKLLYEE